MFMVSGKASFSNGGERRQQQQQQSGKEVDKSILHEYETFVHKRCVMSLVSRRRNYAFYHPSFMAKF